MNFEDLFITNCNYFAQRNSAHLAHFKFQLTENRIVSSMLLISLWKTREKNFTKIFQWMLSSQIFQKYSIELCMILQLENQQHTKRQQHTKNPNQSVWTNSTYSSFEKITSGVHQGPIVGPILSNLLINGLILITGKALVFHFANDNTRSNFTQTVTKLLHILKSEPLKIITWFKENFQFF